MTHAETSGRARGAARTETLTLLLTDIEGSTRLWALQPDRMHQALARHNEIVESSVAGAGGSVLQTKGEGDSTFSVFASPSAAVAAALDIQRALWAERWPTDVPVRVRVAVHTGEVEVRHGDYFGVEISRCARIRSSAHGGQTLLSESTGRAVRSALRDGAFLKDLGQHRLKDLDRPERVYQLCHPSIPEDFPPLASLAAMRHNLPVQVSAFIGRQKEIAAVGQLMNENRLVMLTGTGGCGKTRIALRIASDLVDSFRDGVWLVELATVSDERLVPEAVAETLGVREEVGRPLTATLVQDLMSRELLIVLDNCEHLVRSCAELVSTILHACPDITLLATSRQPLGIAGEAVFRVPSLPVPPVDPLPTVEEVRRHESVALFVERALRHGPAFELNDSNARDVAEISRRLDGIPLAIELAASRVNVITPAQILERLDDRFRILTSATGALARHQTLRTAVDWSYDLLSLEERELFDRLSVFVGGFTIEAAENLGTRGGAPSWEVLDRLAGLVDKSLIVAEVREGMARYHMLETIRAYAVEKLESSGEGAGARRALLEWCLGFVEGAEPALTGPDQVLWYDRIDAEHPNVRLALAWGIERPEASEATVRLCGALWRFWLERGHVGEGRVWLDRALARAVGLAPPVRAKALRAAGALAMWQSDLAAARAHHEESVQISRSMDDELGLAASLSHLGIVAWRTGDTVSARRLLEESLRIRIAFGDRAGESTSLGNLGLVAQAEGDYEEARTLLEQSLAIDRELGDKLGIAGSLSYLGELERAAGNLDRAEALHRDGLARQRELRQREVLPMALEGMAGLGAARGLFSRAALLFGAAESLRRAVGLPLPPSAQATYERDVNVARAGLGEKEFERVRHEGREMTLDAAISYALDLDGASER